MLRRNSNRTVSLQKDYTGLLIECEAFVVFEGHCTLDFTGEIAVLKLQATISSSIILEFCCMSSFCLSILCKYHVLVSHRGKTKAEKPI